MLITKTSLLTGETRTLDLPCTEEQIQARRGGALIQNVMPHLTNDEREFIMTGITRDEWLAFEVESSRCTEDCYSFFKESGGDDSAAYLGYSTKYYLLN